MAPETLVETSRRAAALEASLRRVIRGKDDVLRLALVSIFAKGHLLVEGVPGVGKTTLGPVSYTHLSAIGPLREQVQYGLDVVGGRISQEPPNLINIGAEMHIGGTMFARIGGSGMLIKDTYAGDEGARNVARYDPSRKTVTFSEPQCGICGAPRPASHRFCEICLGEKHRRQRKSQRRLHSSSQSSYRLG